MKRTSLRARLLSAPYIVWAAIFIVVPLFIVVYYAFTDRSGVFSLSNITALADYKDTFIISVWYSVIATVITLVIAYPFAYALSRFGANTQRMMMLLVMLPMWMNFLLRTYAWLTILENNGLLNNLLSWLHLPEISNVLYSYFVTFKKNISSVRIAVAGRAFVCYNIW